MNRTERLAKTVVHKKETKDLSHLIDCYNMAVERKDYETARRLLKKIQTEKERQSESVYDEEEKIVATYCKRKGLPYEPPK